MRVMEGDLLLDVDLLDSVWDVILLWDWDLGIISSRNGMLLYTAGIRSWLLSD
jgi:hypothetical protein